MTLTQIETLLVQLQTQVTANTAAINSINNTVSNYATTDDLKELSNQINVLQENNNTLQNSVAALHTSVSKIDNLENLLDVNVNNITVGDILQYDANGKWSNIQPSAINITGSGSSSVTKLSQLQDVWITGIESGQVLSYDALSGKWVNSALQIGDVDLSSYLTVAAAEATYLPLKGGTITGNLQVNGTLLVKGMMTGENNLLVFGGVTMYGEI